MKRVFPLGFVVVLLACAGLFAWAFMQLSAFRAEAAAPVTAEKAFRDADVKPVFLSVANQRGYSFSYPQGYVIDYDNYSKEYVITAGEPPFWEVISVTETQRASEKDVNDVKNSFNASEIVKFEKATINGREAWLLNAYVDEGFGVIERQAFVQCEDAKGQYSIIVTGLIPKDLAPDALLVDETIRSVKC